MARLESASRQYARSFSNRPLASPLALPRGIVGILERQRRQRCGPARRVRAIQRRQLAAQHVQRGAVEADVVHAQRQQCSCWLEPEHAQSHERTRSEIEWLLREVPHSLLRPNVAVTSSTSHDRSASFMHAGEGSTVLANDKRGAQRLVPLNDLAHASLERIHVERPVNHERLRDVVADVVGPFVCQPQ